MKTITFITQINNPVLLGVTSLTYNETLSLINKAEYANVIDIVTTQLTFISTYLFDVFETVNLEFNDKLYELKLGKNTWTDEEISSDHNLFKLVQTHILNKSSQ